MDSLTAHETNESANHLYKEKVSQLDICLDMQHSKSQCLDSFCCKLSIKLLYFRRIIKLMDWHYCNFYMI